MFPFHLIQAVRHCIHRQKADRHFQTLLNWQLTYIKMPSFSGESIYLNTHSHTQKNTLTHPHIQTPKYPRSLSLSNHTHTGACGRQQYICSLTGSTSVMLWFSKDTLTLIRCHGYLVHRTSTYLALSSSHVCSGRGLIMAEILKTLLPKFSKQANNIFL